MSANIETLRRAIQFLLKEEVELAKIAIYNVIDDLSQADQQSQPQVRELTDEEIADAYWSRHPAGPAITQGTIQGIRAVIAADRAIRPAGMVLVPVEPTEEMVAAGYEIHPCKTGSTQVTDCYKAMIASSQKENKSV